MFFHEIWYDYLLIFLKTQISDAELSGVWGVSALRFMAD